MSIYRGRLPIIAPAPSAPTVPPPAPDIISGSPFFDVSGTVIASVPRAPAEAPGQQINPLDIFAYSPSPARELGEGSAYWSPPRAEPASAAEPLAPPASIAASPTAFDLGRGSSFAYSAPGYVVPPPEQPPSVVIVSVPQAPLYFTLGDGSVVVRPTFWSDSIPAPVADAREDDIRKAIHVILHATGEFAEVYLGDFDSPGAAASSWRAASVAPLDSSVNDFSDAALDGDTVIDCRILITLAVRHENQEIRDRIADRLLNLTRNALNGQRLAGITNAQLTKVKNWRWQFASDVERRITLVLQTQYYEPGWSAANTTE